MSAEDEYRDTPTTSVSVLSFVPFDLQATAVSTCYWGAHQYYLAHSHCCGDRGARDKHGVTGRRGKHMNQRMETMVVVNRKTREMHVEEIDL